MEVRSMKAEKVRLKEKTVSSIVAGAKGVEELHRSRALSSWLCRHREATSTSDALSSLFKYPSTSNAGRKTSKGIAQIQNCKPKELIFIGLKRQSHDKGSANSD
jgi:hypothetical protein